MRIEEPVAVDDLVIFVLQQGEIEVAGIALRQFPDETFRILMRIDAYRKDLDLRFFFIR